MHSLLQDIRYAVRLLRRSPGFTIAAVLTLALGMGANTVMFSVLNTVLLRPLPYPQPDRLVQIWEPDLHLSNMQNVVSPYDFLDWRSQSQTFEQMATYDYENLVLTSQKAPAPLNALMVTASFFDVFKIAPLKGRTFLPDEDQPGKPPAVVLSYGAWLRYFGSDPGILGKSIVLNDQAYSVVGIMPSSFAFPYDGMEVWCVPGFDLKEKDRNSRFLQAIGRLKPGVSARQAQIEMSTIAERLAVTYNQPGREVYLISLQEEIVGNSRRGLLVLWVAVVAVLLIACANVAGLLLARAMSRHKEVSIRTALGGSRARLIQQFLTESILLAIIGSALGVALSYSAGRFVIAASHGAVPRLRELQLDGWVLAFTGVACLITGLGFGLAPAISSLRVDLNSSLKETASTTQTSHRFHLRSLFVVMEIALAMVLLVAAGLLTKTLWRLQNVDTGFKAENILTFRFAVPQAKFPTSAQRADLYDRIAERLAALPGVESAGATNDLPFAGSRSNSNFDIEGRPPDPAVAWQADYRTVSSGYFWTMRMRLLQGRPFSPHDNRESPFVTVVNQAFVKKFFPDENPLGHHLRSHGKLYEIVGVIGDVKHQDLSAPGLPEIYLCYLQADVQPWTFFAVRSRIEPQPLANSIRNAVKEIAPEEPIYRINTMTRLVDFWISPHRFSSLLLTIFAGLAVVLAAIGIYGVIAYSVIQRTREIGVRMALGANRTHVLQLILGQVARIGGLGLLIGTVAAYLATRTLSILLFDVQPHDPFIFFGVATSIMLVVVLASYMPARRATRVDPLAALRYE